MATIQGIAGGLRGKMGNVVFRQRQGQTVASQYQPVVANPRTEGQNAARAKFKLMSQLAAIMERGIGTMGVTERAARGKETPRNRFFQLNYPLVITNEDGNEVQAKIPMAQLQLTSSFRAFSPEITQLEPQPDTLSGKLSGISNEITMVRLVVVHYTNNIPAQAFLSEVQLLTVEEGQAEYLIERPFNTDSQVTLLAYGLIPSESAGNVTIDDIHTIERSTSQVVLNKLVRDGLLTETKTVGINAQYAA